MRLAPWSTLTQPWRRQAHGSTTVRLAQPGEEDQIDAFLAQHAPQPPFLRSFLARGGLVDEGKPLQGTYAIALTGGQVVGVAMHTWNGIIHRRQAPESTAALVRMAVAVTGRPLVGLGGPWSQVERRRWAGRSGCTKALTRGPVCPEPFGPHCPAPHGLLRLMAPREERDLGMLRDWRFDYEVECTGLPGEDATRAFVARPSGPRRAWRSLSAGAGWHSRVPVHPQCPGPGRADWGRLDAVRATRAWLCSSGRRRGASSG